MMSTRKLVMAGTLAIFGLVTISPLAAYAESASTAPKKVEKKMMHKKHVANAEVKMMQGALDKAGYKLKADGMMGAKTRAALKKYQKSNGLKVTGKLDKETKAKLGMK